MKTQSHQHIIVGMSGGVDSSVTALLLKQAGHHVEGVFMKNWEEDGIDGPCPASIDAADAEAVADKIGIEFQRVNFAAEYWERVFTHFLTEYRAGRTPNPDVLCNKEIKFRAFLDYAIQRGADCIATGHYARRNHQLQLLKGFDSDKDQSYFLHLLNEKQLAKSLFPLGELDKKTVRKIASEAGLANHAKKDSTGICFIGERKFKAFLSEYLPAKPGSIETPDGKVLGEHDGLMFYTLGQRQGLKIGGQKGYAEIPWFVVAKDLANNKLIVAQGEHPLLYSRTLIAENVHWINGIPAAFPLKATAKTRYRQRDQMCMIHAIHPEQYEVVFTEPQRAVTPGQSVVFYQDNVCLGGGMIRSSR